MSNHGLYMEKRSIYWIIGIIVIVIIILGITLVILRGFNRGEDNWIKDSRGVYVKHGNPSSVPQEVKDQQELINCSEGLFGSLVMTQVQLDSQCLGKCSDYSVDLVHVPRSPEDDLAGNQCAEFKNGVTKHFIEIDNTGKVVRIV